MRVQRFSPQRAIVRSLYFKTAIPKGVSLEEHQERQKSANAIIDRQIQQRPRVITVDLSTAFFDADGRSHLGGSQGSFYRDRSHVSDVGAQELIRPLLDDVLAEISRARKER